MSVAAAGTGTTLSSSFFMKKFYRNCANAAKSNKRSDYTANRLSQADADALHQAVKQLRNYKFTKDEGTNIYGNVMAFVETYNNTLDSSTDSSDPSVNRYAKQLKYLAQNHKDELQGIGITVNKDGSLTAKENLVKKASVSDVKALFSKESDFSTKVFQYSRHLESKSEEAYNSEISAEAAKQKETLAAQQAQQDALLTGIGGSVDISV